MRRAYSATLVPESHFTQSHMGVSAISRLGFALLQRREKRAGRGKERGKEGERGWKMKGEGGQGEGGEGRRGRGREGEGEGEGGGGGGRERGGGRGRGRRRGGGRGRRRGRERGREKDLDTWNLLKDCAVPALSLAIPSLMPHLHTYTHTHTYTPDEVCDFTSQFARVCVS
jgi:hypothetical protein